MRFSGPLDRTRLLGSFDTVRRDVDASGSMDLTVLVSLLCGSLPGIVLSSQFAPRMPDAVLRYVLAITLILVSLRLLSA